MSQETNPRVPLQQWRLRNFKSVRRQVIDFGPLTLLVGGNSSGKSSVLQSILMVAQAVQSQASSGVFGLNGTLVDLGTIEDVRREGGRGGISVGGRVESSKTHGVAHSWSGHRYPPMYTAGPGTAVVDWHMQLTRWGPAESGAVAVGLVELDARSGTGDGEERTLQLERAKTQPAPDVLWAERSDAASGAGPTAAPLAGYEGTAAIAHPDGAQEALGGAQFSGPFPVLLAAKKPLVSSVVEQWSRDVVRFTQSLAPLGTVLPSIEPRAWWPADAATTFDELVARLTESLRRHREEASGPADWPLRLLDFDLLADEDPVDAVIGALWTVDVDDDYRNMAALDELQTGSTSRPEQPQDDAEEDPWLQRGRAVQKILRDDLAALCAAVNDAVGDTATSLTEPGVQASLVARYSADVADFFGKRVFYIGPLREDPHPVNRRSLVPGSRALGTKGEYMTAVLLDHAQDQIDAPWPGDDVLERRQVTLKAAVEEWLRYFQVAAGVELKETSAGPSLRVKDRSDGKWLHLTHVGVGVSQLLPVIVMCLMAKEGSVIMLEQPELHLHPALQQRLGDFLLACASSGRQLIVETHSEYLVSRLRRRIADAPDDSLIPFVRILFAEKDDDSGTTTFNPVVTNEYGGIERWPKGFFDQATSEAQEILKAAVRKRRTAADERCETDPECGES